MHFWFSRSARERGAAFVAAAHGGASAFAHLGVTARGLLRAALLLAPPLWRVTSDKRRKRAKNGRS